MMNKEEEFISCLAPKAIFLYRIEGKYYPKIFDYFLTREQFYDLIKDVWENYATDQDLKNLLSEIEKIKIHKKEKPEEPEEIKGYIYILESENGEYKIGMTSKEPTERLAQISPLLPYKVKLIMLKKSTNIHEEETRFHNMFEEKRLNGEWFELSPHDLLDLNRLYGFMEWKNVN